MKTLFKAGMLCALLVLQTMLYAQEQNHSTTKTANTMKQVLIDKLTVPAAVKDEFIQRMTINRNIIHGIPGFEKDEVYERTDENGNFVFVTIATWTNGEFLRKAKALVDAEYKRTGFDVKEFCEKRNIVIERNIYQSTEY